MDALANIPTVSHAIQQAVAPVFLLFVAAMLTLISGLLSFLREIALATGVIEMRRF